jgi:hypothetical protein
MRHPSKTLLTALLLAAPAVALAAGCSAGADNAASTDEDITADAIPDLDLGMVAKRGPDKPSPKDRLLHGAAPAANASVAASPKLTYRGGPMLENVEVHTVFWGSKIPQATQTSLASFYQAVPTSGSKYFAMLSEYDTPQPPQTIGFGSYLGSYVDSDAPTATTVTDAQIQAEVARLIDQEKLPANDGRNIFMVYFPPGVVIDQGGGSLSCQVFCAYHGSFQRNGNEVYYGVFPDLTSGGCEKGCGFNAKAIDNLYSVSTHELVEATTDAAVGDNILAWYDDANGEIGDICAFFPDAKVRGYAVQNEWSNQDRGCRAGPSKANVTIDATPAQTTVATGSTATFTVTAAGTLRTKASLKAMGLPTGVTAKFVPAAIKPGQTSTLTLTAAPGLLASASGFAIAASDTNGEYHYVMPGLTVKGVAPTAASLEVSGATAAKGPSQGGTTITLHGTGLSQGVKVTVGGTGAAVVQVSADGTSLVAVTPSHAAGAADVVLTNPDAQTAALAGGFTFEAGAAPTASKLWPPSGPAAGGQLITVDGAGFGPDDQGAIPTVTIGGKQAQSFATATQVLFLTPGGNAGDVVDVVITNGDGQSVKLAGAFTYGPAAPPAIAGLTLTSAPASGGAYLTLSGTDFQPGAHVFFDGKEATIFTNNATFLGLLVPPHPKGAVDVVVQNVDGQTATATAGFTYR